MTYDDTLKARHEQYNSDTLPRESEEDDTPAAKRHSIPAFSGEVRPPIWLDPIAREQLSQITKWALLGGLVLGLWTIAATYHSQNLAGVAQDDSPQQHMYYRLLAVSVAVICTALGTGLPRTILPGLFGHWNDAVEAARDWILAGILTGVLYLGVVAYINHMPDPTATAQAGKHAAGATATPVPKTPPAVTRVDQPEAQPEGWSMHEFVQGTSDKPDDQPGVWFRYRYFIFVFLAWMALALASRLAIHKDDIASSKGTAVQILVQGLLAGIPFWWLQNWLNGFDQQPDTSLFLLIATGGLIGGSIFILCLAFSADRKLMALHHSGVKATDDAVTLTITVVGGKEAGKTMLLAGAYYEWATQIDGTMTIRPVNVFQGADMPLPDQFRLHAVPEGSPSYDLATISNNLYSRMDLPMGNVICSNLPFELRLDGDVVARFNFLDYPGGALRGVASDGAVKEFWRRVEDTDGVLFVADMSYIRRDRRDNDFTDVMMAYRDVMEKLVMRNGSTRVVPVALALTKCDEYVDPTTNRTDEDKMFQDLEQYGYGDLKALWEALNNRKGPRFIEFRTFPTSAISYSEPSRDNEGRVDLSRPFQIKPPPPPIRPQNCAAPILWVSAKAMRWNITMFGDLKSFLLGSSAKQRRHKEAIQELEARALRRNLR